MHVSLDLERYGYNASCHVYSRLDEIIAIDLTNAMDLWSDGPNSTPYNAIYHC